MRLSFNGTYPITRSFGVVDPAYSRYPGSRHPGTDWGVPANTPLVAGMPGTVRVFLSTARIGRGNEVWITGGNKSRRVCHMSRVDVKTGQRIEEGQPIGLSGYTGYVVDSQGKVGTPAGAHVHDELLIDGQYTDLVPYLAKERKTETMTAKEVDEMIASTYVAIAGRDPKDVEFVFHREQYAKQGDKWWLLMIQGFKGDDIAWKKYERNLQDAGKLLAENPDAKKLAEIKQVLERR